MNYILKERRLEAGTRWFLGVAALIGCSGTIPASAADLVKGRQLYEQHCASCHGIDGKSRFPDVPDLRRSGAGSIPGFDAVNKLKLGSPRKPSFLGRLSDQQLMETLVYARTLR